MLDISHSRDFMKANPAVFRHKLNLESILYHNAGKDNKFCFNWSKYSDMSRDEVEVSVG
ncbi:hypothetical protein M7I_4773 [Glarea lozoyensis 74030]|uniref:Uncharacterized protein n=1 Tax=Glarea lozoyensis (strain ATCC 74030 / MF5533) TaxID=1104152 RepID=H0EQ30_GLAL7|nr:hypothetical protein M7I_4773 [Glarea lozoyensis 74030]